MCQFFRSETFEFEESFYSYNLWKPLLNFLFTGFSVETEYNFRRIDFRIKSFKADFVVRIRDKPFASK